MQIDADSKMIYIHIPRTGGSWFSYAWSSHKNIGKINYRGGLLRNNVNDTRVKVGRHGRLSGVLNQLQVLEFNYHNYKIITTIRHPIDRVLSSWSWFSDVKETAQKAGWKGIHDMLDEFEDGQIRVNYLPQVFWLEEENAKWDHIFRFEDLLLGPQKVTNVFPLFTPETKLRRQGRERGYKHYLKQDEIDRIKILYKEDIEYLKPYYPDLK